MIRLEEELIESASDDSSKERSHQRDLIDNHNFAKQVLKKMEEVNIAPTPYNFQIYYEALLDDSSSELKEKINSLRQSEIVDNDLQRIKMEKEVKESFSGVKTMVQSISTTYKSIALVKGVVKKRVDDLQKTNSQLTAKNITSNLAEDMGKFDTLMSNQLKNLKISYEKVVSSLKSIEQESIYDIRYSLYNKKYLLNTIESEKKSIASQGHKSSLMFIKVKNDILNSISFKKDRLILVKNIAKLLQKTSRRSDIVAHYEDGIFAMLMKHTSITSASKACERVSSLVYSSSFFIGDEEIDIDIEIAVLSLGSQSSVEEDIVNLLDALPKTSKKSNQYITI